MFNSQRQPLALSPDLALAKQTPSGPEATASPELVAPETIMTEAPAPGPQPSPPQPRLRLNGGAAEEPSPSDEPPAFLMPPPAAAPRRVEMKEDRRHLLLAGVASLTWIVGLIALALAFPDTLAPLSKGPIATIALFVLLAAPLALIWTAASILGEGRRLLAETRRARAMTEEMLAPAAAAAAGAGGLVESLHGQIAEASAAAKNAGERLARLRDAVAEETELLAQATSHADQTASKLVASLSAQRVELNTLAVTLEARAAAVTDAMNRQAVMVGDASDLAETQLGEAQAALTARSADLAAAGAEAAEATRVAAEDLARQAARLEVAGTGVGDQLRALEEGLTSQRAGLVTVSHGLRAEQEEFAALAETRSAQLSTLITSAAREAQSLNEAAAHGAKSVSVIVDQAGDRFGELVASAGEQQREFETASALAVRALEDGGASQRTALGEALRGALDSLSGAVLQADEAAQEHARKTSLRIDEINEAAFAASNSAEKTLDQRLVEARSLIEQSAHLVDEAAERAATKLAEAFAGASRSLTELRELSEETLAAADRLPSEAGERGEAIRASLAGAMDDLLASARRTAEETQAIDAAFQERVRRNYEMLSEAVKLMGVVAHSGPEPAPPRRTPAPVPPPGSPEPDLKPRLKLSAPASAPSEPRWDDVHSQPSPDWNWKGLATGHVAGEIGRDSPFNEIAAMGIDPAALLTRGRIEEIAAAIQAGDDTGAREVVRTLAPAATRRLSRRILGDAAFGEMSRGFVGRYAGELEAAVRADAEGYQTASLLSSDLGRAYLLLDASTVSAS